MQPGHAAIQKQRVRQFEVIAEDTSEFVERNRLIGNDKNHSGAVFGRADAIADISGIAVYQEPWVQFAVDHQHRAGLRGVDAIGTRGFVGQRFDHIGAVFPDAEDAVGQKPEIARPGIGDDPHDFLTVLDIMSNRRAVVVIHPGIHTEDQRFALLCEGPVKCRELSVSFA